MVQIHRYWLLPSLAKPHISNIMPSQQICNRNIDWTHIPIIPYNALHEANHHNQKEDSMKPVPQTKTNDKTQHVYITINNLSGKLYSDQTSHFPVTSIWGNYHVFIFYTADGNHIKSFPIKYRHRNKLLKCMRKSTHNSKSAGTVPNSTNYTMKHSET